MNKQLKHVQLHAVPFVDGCGQLKSTLSPQNYVGMKMLWTEDGVLVDYKGASFIIPLANIIAATFAEGGAVANQSAPPKTGK